MSDLQRTIETLIWSKMWRIPSFFQPEKFIPLRVSPMLLIIKKCTSHFREEPKMKIKSLKKQRYWYLIYTDQLCQLSSVTWVPSFHPERVSLEWQLLGLTDVIHDTWCELLMALHNPFKANEDFKKISLCIL